MGEENGRGRPLLLVLSVDSGVEFPAAGQGSVLKVRLNPLERNENMFSGESSPGGSLAGESGGACLLKPSFWH